MLRRATATFLVALAPGITTGCKTDPRGTATCAELVARIQKEQRAMMESREWPNLVQPLQAAESLIKSAREAGARSDDRPETTQAKIRLLAPVLGKPADLEGARPRVTLRCEVLPLDTVGCLGKNNWADALGRFENVKGCMDPARFVEIFVDNR
jgi:hypothetical protein